MAIVIPLFFLAVAGVIWYFLAEQKQAAQAKKLKERSNIQARSESLQHCTTHDDSEGITITVNIADVDAKALTHSARLAECRKNRIKWSGRSHGLMPIKRFTDNQWQCMCSAVNGKRICPENQINSRPKFTNDISVHSTRTVNSLAKHGFLELDGNGTFVCTDKGAQAYEQVPVRF